MTGNKTPDFTILYINTGSKIYGYEIEGLNWSIGGDISGVCCNCRRSMWVLEEPLYRAIIGHDTSRDLNL